MSQKILATNITKSGKLVNPKKLNQENVSFLLSIKENFKMNVLKVLMEIGAPLK